MKPERRTHPGHRLVVSFEPEQRRFRAGETVKIVMTIKNVGDAPVSFDDGGMQRGSRNNQFGFTAFATEGKPVPDTGDARHHGGIVGRPTLKPGETFNKTVELDKWFRFDEPGSYLVLCTFRLPIGHAGSLSPIWDDFAAGECAVTVEK